MNEQELKKIQTLVREVVEPGPDRAGEELSAVITGQVATMTAGDVLSIAGTVFELSDQRHDEAKCVHLYSLVFSALGEGMVGRTFLTVLAVNRPCADEVSCPDHTLKALVKLAVVREDYRGESLSRKLIWTGLTHHAAVANNDALMRQVCKQDAELDQILNSLDDPDIVEVLVDAWQRLIQEAMDDSWPSHWLGASFGLLDHLIVRRINAEDETLSHWHQFWSRFRPWARPWIASSLAVQITLQEQDRFERAWMAMMAARGLTNVCADELCEAGSNSGGPEHATRSEVATCANNIMDAARATRLEIDSLFKEAQFPSPEEVEKMEVDPILKEVSRLLEKVDERRNGQLSRMRGYQIDATSWLNVYADEQSGKEVSTSSNDRRFLTSVRERAARYADKS